MSNDIKIIYVTDLIPNLSNDSPFYQKILKDKDFNVFKWQISDDINNNYKIELYCQQLLDFLNELKHQNVRVVLDGFAAVIYHMIEKYINIRVDFIYIINPFDRNLLFLTLNVKQKFLPNTVKLTIYKYIYLFNNLDNFRENENWTRAINNENKFLFESNVLYHKLIDQILSLGQVKSYESWLSKLSNAKLIIGDKNRLINFRLINCKQNQLVVINDAGYCIHWEKFDLLFNLIKE